MRGCGNASLALMDNSPTALFHSYEQDFQHILKTVQEKLDADEVGEQKKAALRRVEMELDEADEMVSQMEIEIQGIPQSLKAQYQGRLRASKADLARYKKLSKEYQTQMSRSDLLSSPRPGGPTFDEPYGLTSDRTRLLAGTGLLEDGTRRLQESQRIALETEDLGADILTNLRTQREQIEHSRDTLRVADGSIDRATGTLKKMVRRMYQQRVVTGAIIFVLVLLIGIILWEKFS